MKVAVLGATGGVGQEAVKQALAAGHTVTAVVRSPEKMTQQHDNLKIVKGDIFSVDSLKEHFAEHDAVMSALGFPIQRTAEGVTGYLEATKAVVEAMRACQVKRLVICHSWYTNEEARAKAPFFLRWTIIPFIKPVLINMDQTEQWIKENAMDIDFTIVAPAGLKNSPVTDKDFIVKEDEFQVPGAAGQIARADVARFMVMSLGKEEHHKKFLAIAV